LRWQHAGSREVVADAEGSSAVRKKKTRKKKKTTKVLDKRRQNGSIETNKNRGEKAKSLDKKNKHES